MAETFVVPVRGIGKPDYTREIATGLIRPGFQLKYLQNLKFFALMPTTDPSPYPWRVDPIAVGVTQSLIDGETGLDMPFTVQLGYTLDVFSFMMKPREDVKFVLWLDGDHFVDLGITPSGISLMHSDIVALGTSLIDPTGSAPHTFDIRATNLGGGLLEMGCVFYCFYEAVGTPPLPTTKEVKCGFCGHLYTVPRNTSKVICPKCGELNIYLDLSKCRGSK